MILQIHADASYLNETKGCSTAGGIFFMGNKLENGKPIFLNGAIHTISTILKHVAASAAEAKLGSLFLNAKEAKKY
eukprot:2054366-Ditylum_brightwellii.AAC.1